MYIDRIILKNFRIYKGKNELNLHVSSEQNVTVITGNNGFGKTSLLTSLVWCLYGKLMGDVEERYRKEIYDGGGYKSYCSKLMNRIALENYDEMLAASEGMKKDKTLIEKAEIEKQLNETASFSVSIRFKRIFIPAMPCDDLELIRTYNLRTNTESLSILMDGQQNELTKKVGSEIFINDFILRKEIAKFFFFDAEKIVDLAEVKSIEDRRALGLAYTEVLGIKKYLNLKVDLENLRLRLSKRTATGADKERIEKLDKQFLDNTKLIEHHNTIIKEKEDELAVKKTTSDKFQERLIREGASISLDEMKEFKLLREQLQHESNRLKNMLKEMMEMAPLAIAANLLQKVKEQLEAEQEKKDNDTNIALLKRKLTNLKTAISKSEIFTSDKKKLELFALAEKVLIPEGEVEIRTLLNFSPEQGDAFFAVYEMLQNSFSKHFKTLVADSKQQQTSLALINRKLTDAESKEKDPIITAIRIDKTRLDSEIGLLESEVIELKAKLKYLSTEQNSISSQLSELRKKLDVFNKDRSKDEVAARLIGELDNFIYKLKLTKKKSLEEKIYRELNLLMHKANFVKKVEVQINGDLIDIELYDQSEKKIDKNSLSKGEQQLYATALLKALVDESHIRFPVFIDSPLQKFDKEHARNIIQDFYPNVSAQVILFPLLEKELNEAEFKLLYPRIADCYSIHHVAQYESGFKKMDPAQLFNAYQTV